MVILLAPSLVDAGARETRNVAALQNPGALDVEVPKPFAAAPIASAEKKASNAATSSTDTGVFEPWHSYCIQRTGSTPSLGSRLLNHLDCTSAGMDADQSEEQSQRQ